MARRATSLGPKPSLFLFCFVFFVVFVGGFRGQVRWPEGPPHLALNPPYFLFVLFCFCFFFFPFFASKRQKTLFPPLEKGIFCLFLSVSLCFSLACFGLPLFQFLFLCPSLVLLFLFTFLSFFLLSFCSLFFSLSFLFFLYLLLFHERNNSKTLNCNLFFLKYFQFFGFPSCFSFHFLSLLFLILSYVFCSTSMFLASKKVEKHQFLNKTLFYEPVFCKMWKLFFFVAHFLPNFGWCSKHTIK